jgi:hypothetical protein
MDKIRILVDMGGEKMRVYMSRVPIAGESIQIKDQFYEVRHVTHHTTGIDVAAEIEVSLPA